MTLPSLHLTAAPHHPFDWFGSNQYNQTIIAVLEALHRSQVDRINSTREVLKTVLTCNCNILAPHSPLSSILTFVCACVDLHD
jgi:hypothetical protein